MFLTFFLLSFYQSVILPLALDFTKLVQDIEQALGLSNVVIPVVVVLTLLAVLLSAIKALRE